VQRKKDRKIAKKAENSTFKPLSTIFVPCWKIQGGHGPPFPAADAHDYAINGMSSLTFNGKTGVAWLKSWDTLLTYVKKTCKWINKRTRALEIDQSIFNWYFARLLFLQLRSLIMNLWLDKGIAPRYYEVNARTTIPTCRLSVKPIRDKFSKTSNTLQVQTLHFCSCSRISRLANIAMAMGVGGGGRGGRAPPGFSYA